MKVLHTRKVPIMDEQGFPAYLLGVSEDITEYKQTQAQIQALNEQLQEQIRSLNAVNKELEAFSYSVSHDLRAPLRTIDGFSQAILEDYADRLDEDGKRYLTRIREGSQQMAQLIDDMLNLSRLTRGEMNKASVNMSEMARAIAQDLKRHEPGRSVEFRIQDGMVVHADKRLIQAVLENLLGNSWKFTSHHPDALIEFGVIEKDEKPVYFVKDNGAGFDMAYADKLFGVFQRLHDASEFEGTGVGLASVQRIIHRHGGDIWAEGAVNKGATFYFTI
jgi:light-regulated signal transduction histidine kinase (bacteriophytochrome)